ncbi:MAG: DUF5615 family PIN-like protein [Polyangiaceae bacterium]|jgi:hypothetical protein
MMLLIDEDVPAAVVELLRSRGHDIQTVVEAFGQHQTPDHAVVGCANARRRIVVTFNLRHYNRLVCRAPLKGYDRFPDAGLIICQCPHPVGRARLEQFIEAIEHEHDFLERQREGDRRLIVQITETLLKVVR